VETEERKIKKEIGEAIRKEKLCKGIKTRKKKS